MFRFLSSRIGATLLLGVLGCATPLHHPTTDVRLERATTLVRLLARRDFPGAERYLRANAAPGSIAARVPENEIIAFKWLLTADQHVSGVALEGDDHVAAQLESARGTLLSAQVRVEPTPPYRITEVYPSTGERPDVAEGTPLPATSSEWARAASFVDALNAPGSATTRRFVEDGWTMGEDETADTVVDVLRGLSARLVAPLTLEGVTRLPNGELELEVHNARGSVSRFTVALAGRAPYRLTITGLALRPEREARPGESVPGIVELATPVVRVPLTFTNGRPVVEVTIAGKGPFRMLLETGSEQIELTPRVVAALGASIEPITDDNLYRVAGGFVDHLHRVNDLRIGGARFGDLVAVTHPSIAGSDGIIGLPAYRNLLMTVDYEQSELRLTKGDLPPVNGTDVLPLRRIFGDLLGLDIRIGATTVPTIVDTQSGFGLLLAAPIADSVRFEQPPVALGSVTMGGTAIGKRSVGRLADDLAFGGFTFPRQIASVIDYPPNWPRLGNIGREILGNFVMTIDQRNMRIQLLRRGSTVIEAPRAFRSFGLATSMGRDGTVRVTQVLPGRPAARAGVAAGDVVVRVGDVVPASLPAGHTVQALLERLAQSDAPVVLALERGAAPRPVTLQSEVLVP